MGYIQTVASTVFLLLAAVGPTPAGAQPDSYSKSEIDAKLDALKKQLTTDTVSKAAFDIQYQALSQRLEDRIPSVSPWVSLGVPALISLLVAGGTTYASRRNTKRDLARSRSQTLVSEWSASFDLIGEALYTLSRDPQRLSDPRKYDQVRRAGNFYDRVGQAWRHGDAEPSILRISGVKASAQEFWKDLTDAKESLDKTPIAGVDLGGVKKDWAYFEWLVR